MATALIKLNKARNKFNATPTGAMNAKFDNVPGAKFVPSSSIWTFPNNRIVCKLLDEMVKAREPIKLFSKLEMDTVSEAANWDPASFKRPIPAGFKFKTDPLPVQQACYKELWGMPHMSLSCDVGLGKAKMICDLAGMFFHVGKITGMLVVMPPGICYNFMNEVAKHMSCEYDIALLKYDTESGLRAMKKVSREVDGRLQIMVAAISRFWVEHPTPDGKKIAHRGPGIKHCEEFMRAHDCFMAIDESHSIKNAEKVQWRNSKYLSQFAQHRLIATGTQTSRKTLDIFGQYDFLDSEIIGIDNYRVFKSTFCLFGGFKGKSVVGFKNEDLLVEQIAPFTFVATREDWLNLPDLTREQVFVEKHPSQQKYIDKVIDERTELMGREDLKDWEKENAIAQYATHIQLVSGGFYFNRVEGPPGEEDVIEHLPIFKKPNDIPKVQHLLSFLEGLFLSNPEAKVLLWAHFRVEQQMLSEVLGKAKIKTTWVKSGLQPKAKNAMLVKFQEDPEARVLLGHQQAMGTGLTINEATTSYFYSSPRDPISRTQAEGRNYRYGQTDGVLHLDVFTRGTYDKRIFDSLVEGADFDASLKKALMTGDSDMLY